MTLRIDEIYVSMQGEGPRVGIPTIFVRFGGCNLRCPGWPCDTQHAIDAARYRSEWIPTDPTDVLRQVVELRKQTGAENVCLTGGEPFLQPKKDLEALVVHGLVKEDFFVECFSNGTLQYPDWAIENIRFVMDWKLPGSGEDPRNFNRFQNLNRLREDISSDLQAVKFVIKDLGDFELAMDLWHRYLAPTDIQVFAGVVWDSITNEQLVDWILAAKLPWRLNVQLHNYIWDRDKRGK